MVDRVLLGASHRTFYECLDIAQEHGIGIEIQAFAYPDVLEGEWPALVEEYRNALENVHGELAMHGPFLDMASGSPDPLIRKVVRRRIEQSLEIGAMLDVRTIVFHA